MRAHNNYFKDSLQNPDSGAWNLFGAIGILLCLVIFLIQWQQLPFFLDMYYHLAVAKGFEACGGITGHNFWEYGPQGAAHLYPPLTHIIILWLLKIGIDGIAALKLLSCLMPALFLLALWYVVKNILNRKTAFFTVFLGLSGSLFTISASFTPAATLAIIFLLLGIYCIYKRQTIAAILIFGLLFYTHIGIAVISVFFIILARLFNVLEYKRALKILFFSLLIGLPWIFHIIRNLPGISWQNTAQMPLRLYPVILIFSIVGIITAFKKNKRYGIFLILGLSLAPMAIFYPFRFFCAQGAAGFLLFAAIGLEKIHSLIDKKLRKRKITEKYSIFSFVILLSYLIFFSPSIEIANGYFKASDSLFTSVFEGKERSQKYLLSSSIFDRYLIDKLSGYIENYSKKGEFIWSNYRYIAGILWTETGRPTLSHMLLEITPRKEYINIHSAKLLIIIDEPKGEFEKVYKRLKGCFEIIGLEKEERIDIYILKNKNWNFVRLYDVHKPVVSIAFAFTLLALYSAAIITFKSIKILLRQ